MRYEVRYIVDGQEESTVVDVETAAEAAETARQEHASHGENFELIQVHLLDDLAPDHLETISEF
jgi:hypothetical protein